MEQSYNALVELLKHFEIYELYDETISKRLLDYAHEFREKETYANIDKVLKQFSIHLESIYHYDLAKQIIDRYEDYRRDMSGNLLG